MTEAAPTLTCPIPRCQAVVDPSSAACPSCDTPLAAYTRLRAHPALLFNKGLAAARSGHPAEARDHFAAVVLWNPHDTEARTALALACLDEGDPEEARRQWHQVLTRRPHDETALKGIAWLEARPADED